MKQDYTLDELQTEMTALAQLFDSVTLADPCMGLLDPATLQPLNKVAAMPALDAAGRGLKIEKAVMRLPDSYRITFEMSRYQDKTYKEIAKELNVSIKLVEYRIQQALRLLRVELKDYLPLITIIFPYFL
jgi:DNA-directed RNA polymerase specialized sigma24 family protein